MLAKYKSATEVGLEGRLVCYFFTCTVTTWGTGSQAIICLKKQTHIGDQNWEEMSLLSIAFKENSAFGYCPVKQTLVTSICLYSVDVHRNAPISFRLSSWGGCCHLAMALWKQQLLMGILSDFGCGWDLWFLKYHWCMLELTHNQDNVLALEILEVKALFWQVFISCSASFPWSLREFRHLSLLHLLLPLSGFTWL